MKSSTRYTLIATGFVVFLILAPLLVFYVSGRPVNLDGIENGPTGILDAKTNPSGAQLLVNDKEHSTTPSIARFLNQGEYVFTLRKDGYYDWTKRLPIEASKVTYAQEGVTEIQLIKKSEPRTIISGNVNSFLLINDQIWFTRGNQIIYAPLGNPDKQQVINLGFTPNSLQLLRNKKHIYLGQDSFLNTENKSVIKLPISFSDTPNVISKLAVTPNDDILYITRNNSLYAYESSTGRNWLVKESVYALTMVGNTGYFSQPLQSGSTQLKGTITTAFWNGSEFRDFQTLTPEVSLATDLFITDNKELFCVCGTELERVGQELQSLTSNAKVFLDTKSNELSFLTTGNELMFYNFLTSKPQLLTRGNLKTDYPFMIRSSLGYGFIGNENGLEIIEIDSRDNQNRYQVLQGKRVWEIALSDNQKTILALMDGSIVALDIRN